jgi:ring-1,2-phenylacetyl-CoA epoxidase subunit PaaD
VLPEGGGRPAGSPAEVAGPNGAEVRCPFCGSPQTEPVALFGSTLLTSQYRCRACRTYFEWIRWRPEPEGGETG